MDIKYLDWDSKFFNKKIGKFNLDFDDISYVEFQFEKAIVDRYKLIYVFTNPSFFFPPAFLSRYKGILVDTKVKYRQKLLMNTNSKSLSNIHTFQVGDDLETLYNLAYLSGNFSRFKKDIYFSDHEFKNLYRTWIDNSIKGVLADKIFLYKKNDNILGMVTVKILQEIGTIGLMATDNESRGKGIGTALLNQARIYLSTNCNYNLEVTTQKANKLACRFYEANGMEVKQKTNVYHFWL